MDTIPVIIKLRQVHLTLGWSYLLCGEKKFFWFCLVFSLYFLIWQDFFPVKSSKKKKLIFCKSVKNIWKINVSLCFCRSELFPNFGAFEKIETLFCPEETFLLFWKEVRNVEDSLQFLKSTLILKGRRFQAIEMIQN